MKTQITDTSKELAVFKKYGYTPEQMVNLDLILTPQEIKDLPQELKTAWTSWAGKMAIEGKSLDKKSTSDSLWNNPLAAFFIGVGLAFAVGYMMTKSYNRMDSIK